MTIIAMTISIIIGAASLAVGYWQGGLGAFAPWMVLYGVLWLVAHWRRYYWFSSLALFLAVIAAGYGVWREFPTVWMLLGALGGLLGWDLSDFARRLRFAAPTDNVFVNAFFEIDVPTGLTRDPFVISPHYFPKPTALVEMDQEAGKSRPPSVEDAEQVFARRTTQLRALVERMKLDAAMAKGEMAVISGMTYRQGDFVATEGSEQIKFLLAEVRHRSVILECEDRRFELKMATP